MEEREQIKVAEFMGTKKTEPLPYPPPVNPVHVQPRSRSEPTKGRRIEAEPRLYTFAPLGTSQSLGGPQSPPSAKSLRHSDKSKSRSIPGKSEARRENPSGKLDSEGQVPATRRKIPRENSKLQGEILSRSDSRSGISSLSGSSELPPDHDWLPPRLSYPQARVRWSIEE